MSLHSHSLRSLPEAAAADKATVAVAVCVCVRVCACVCTQAGPTLVSADLSVLNYVALQSHKPIICPFKALEHTQEKYNRGIFLAQLKQRCAITGTFLAFVRAYDSLGTKLEQP